MERARLCLLFTPDLCTSDPDATLRAALAGGVDLVQWRVATRDAGAAAACLATCAEHGVPLIVNDDLELALEIDAAGVHVGQDDMPAIAARARLGARRTLGVSTHDEHQIRAAVAAGADYLGFGPVFPTATKGYTQALPDGALAAAVELSPVPVFAIGGIAPANIARVTAAGARHVAVSAAILRAGDPGAAARALRAALEFPVNPARRD